MVEFKVGDWVEFEHDEGSTLCEVIGKSDPMIVRPAYLRMFSGRTADGRHVGAYCDRVLRVVNPPGESCYTETMANSKIVGYVVKNNNGEYVAPPGEGGWTYNHIVTVRPAPVSRGDAYRRLAAFFDENDGWDPPNQEQFYVAPVFHEPTPMERAAEELGGLLVGLCSRHGLDLGLTREQIEKQIVKELEELKAGGSTFVVTGVPQIR